MQLLSFCNLQKKVSYIQKLPLTFLTRLLRVLGQKRPQNLTGRLKVYVQTDRHLMVYRQTVVVWAAFCSQKVVDKQTVRGASTSTYNISNLLLIRLPPQTSPLKSKTTIQGIGFSASNPPTIRDVWNYIKIKITLSMEAIKGCSGCC